MFFSTQADCARQQCAVWQFPESSFGFAIAGAVILLASTVGCGPSGPAVEFVEGVVLMNGEPIEGVTIGFSPVNGGLSAYGKTDAAGKFHLSTTRGGKRFGGAPVGDYVVVASKWRNRLEDLGPEPDPADVTATVKYKTEADRLSGLPPDYIVPKPYGDKSTSPLKATVRKGRNTGPEFTFDLSKDLSSAR